MRGRMWERAMVLLSRWRVDMAWVGVVVLLLLSHPTSRSILAALPLLGAGIAVRTWARGHLDRAETVTTGGPYALVRHPLYAGSFCIALAFALMAREWVLPFVVSAAFAVMYVPKALREEDYLRRRFGMVYADYASRVGAIVPSVHSAPMPSTSRFAWQRVMRHREWRTWLGVAALLALLCALATLRPPHDPAG